MLLSGAVLACISAVNAFMLFAGIDTLFLAMASVPVEMMYGLIGYLMSLLIKARLKRYVVPKDIS